MQEDDSDHKALLTLSEGPERGNNRLQEKYGQAHRPRWPEGYFFFFLGLWVAHVSHKDCSPPLLLFRGSSLHFRLKSFGLTVSRPWY